MDGCIDSLGICGSWQLYEGQDTPRSSIVDVAQHGWFSNNSKVWTYDVQKLKNSTQKLQVCKGYEAISWISTESNNCFPS